MPSPASILLLQRFESSLYPDSLTELDSAALALLHTPHGKRLAIAAPAGHALLGSFEGQAESLSGDLHLIRCPLTPANASLLRRAIPHLQPTLLGLHTSAGTGDRLGLATPGHVRAFLAVGAPPPLPIFAQQSMRENARTGRTPQIVLDDATWGAFQAGWRGPLGADADHLKTHDDIRLCAQAGYSFFTIDPGAFVDSAADRDRTAALQARLDRLPWQDLESNPASLLKRYGNHPVELEDGRLLLSQEEVLRAAVKYGGAIAHVRRMYLALLETCVPFELEVSVDETETPTTHAEHAFIALEMKRLGVQWVSLAPRYVGRFEKGVEYLSPAGMMGDLDAIAADLDGHAAIARALGPYKLSLHSGSDKFSLYTLFMVATRGMAHLKTAGTSYLEALRLAARVEPDFFRQVYRLALERCKEDRQSYHVSLELEQLPLPASLADEQLPNLLEHFHARQALHVTFGSALAAYGEQLKALLLQHEAQYAETLERHFIRHLRPFARGG